MPCEGESERRGAVRRGAGLIIHFPVLMEHIVFIPRSEQQLQTQIRIAQRRHKTLQLFKKNFYRFLRNILIPTLRVHRETSSAFMRPVLQLILRTLYHQDLRFLNFLSKATPFSIFPLIPYVPCRIRFVHKGIFASVFSIVRSLFMFATFLCCLL